MPLDVAALERASTPALGLIDRTLVKSSGVSAPVTGFSVFDRLYVVVQVLELVGERSPEVEITVEQSSDGNSWAAAAGPVTFTRDGSAVATIDSPLSRLRVSWAVSGGLRRCVIGSVSVTPGSLDAPGGGGGGGSLPTGWTQDGEDPSNLASNGAGDLSTGTLTVGDPNASTQTFVGAGVVSVTGEDGQNALRAEGGVDWTDRVLGFFGASPTTQPAAPSSAQDIADALADLGLLAGPGTVNGGSDPFGYTVTDLDIDIAAGNNEEGGHGGALSLEGGHGDTGQAGGLLTAEAGVSDGGNLSGGKLILAPGDPSGPTPGVGTVQGGSGSAGIAGGDAQLIGGAGDDGSDQPARVAAGGGGANDGIGTPGVVSIRTRGAAGSANQVLGSDSESGVQWQFYIPPASDPHVVGALWNNSGTLAISAG